MSLMDQLETSFRELWKEIGANGSYEKVFYEILKKYSEPQRHYHNLNHVIECLQLLEHFKRCADNLTLIETAIWFHDIEYDPRRTDNEEKSAEYAAETLRKYGVDEIFIEKTRSMIMATKHHQALDRDTIILLDIDLAILGKPEEEFNLYEEQIREEYNWVPVEKYREGRSKILQGFLSRNPIYQTRCIRERYEKQARKNLEESINGLRLR